MKARQADALWPLARVQTPGSPSHICIFTPMRLLQHLPERVDVHVRVLEGVTLEADAIQVRLALREAIQEALEAL